jgi:hypothetical protein
MNIGKSVMHGGRGWKKWVDPSYDAEMMYAVITDGDTVRHPSFKRLVTSPLPRIAGPWLLPPAASAGPPAV